MDVDMNFKCQDSVVFMNYTPNYLILMVWE